ncbi:hypothetical protein QFC20_006789 [Naganishia adeliensis]|uniref:Uncharacterized protein n=1 Tax=Naganishia adeliensis TaxID=92952 RepID=A0ACC2V726_9TREE|nr:hypothetical protein QFC20_006789 [Naganishia adeliensis]
MKPTAILLSCLPLLSLATLLSRQDLPPICFSACLLSAVSESDTDFPLAIDAGDALCEPYESTKPTNTALPVSAPPDITPHVEIKEIAVPVKRQNAADPPTCFNSCLMPSMMTSCRITDTACICRDAPTLALTLNCFSQACSASEFPKAVAAGDSLCAPYDVAVGPSVSTTIGAETGSSLVMAPPMTMPLTSGNGTSPARASTSLARVNYRTEELRRFTSATSMSTDSVSSQTTGFQSSVPLASTATFSYHPAAVPICYLARIVRQSVVIVDGALFDGRDDGGRAHGYRA